MEIKSVRSDEIYKKILSAPTDKKEDIYRYELMKPFEFKWSCYNIPLKAPQKNGYDVIMASSMLGFLTPTYERVVRQGHFQETSNSQQTQRQFGCASLHAALWVHQRPGRPQTLDN